MAGLGDDDLRFAAETARDLVAVAAQVVRELQGKVEARDKGGGQGPVTEADLRSEEILLEGFTHWFPGDGIVAEESRFDSVPEERRIWAIDPLDGTREFAGGRGEYAVMAGLLIEREPVAGAIALPYDDEVYWGWVGGGTFSAAGPVALGAGGSLREATAIHSRAHKGPGLAGLLERLEPARRVTAGSVGYKVAEILRGRAHLYVHEGGGTKWWDTVGPAALVLAAGGSVHNALGGPLRFGAELHHPRGLLFCAPGLGEAAAGRLRGG